MVAVLSGIGLVTFAHDAHAYLDPGTASLILQGIIGGVAAVAAAAAVYWQRVKGFFSRTLGSRALGRGSDHGLAAAESDEK